MNGFSKLAILGVAMAVAVPATAAPRQAIASAQGVRPTRYCVVTPLTGSYIPRRICHVRSAWLDLGVDPLAAK